MHYYSRTFSFTLEIQLSNLILFSGCTHLLSGSKIRYVSRFRNLVGHRRMPHPPPTGNPQPRPPRYRPRSRTSRRRRRKRFWKFLRTNIEFGARWGNWGWKKSWTNCKCKWAYGEQRPCWLCPRWQSRPEKWNRHFFALQRQNAVEMFEVRLLIMQVQFTPTYVMAMFFNLLGVSETLMFSKTISECQWLQILPSLT